MSNSKIVILHCVSIYPTKNKDLNLKNISMLQNTFGYPVGFSDHSLGYVTPLASVALGACVIEKHFIISKKIKSADNKFSIDPRQLQHLKKGIKKICLSLGKENLGLKKVEKNSLKLRRSIFSIKDIKKGEKFNRDNIRSYRPKIGVGSEYFETLIGKKSKKNISKFTPIFKNVF